MSSGQFKPHRGFNPMQIKNGMVVRLRKDGTLQAVLGKVGEYKKNGDGPKAKTSRSVGV